MNARRPTIRAGAMLLSATLAGCASEVRVHGLATAQPEVAAYQLQGSSLADLREQTARLCPQGAEVLRAAEVRSTAVSPSANRPQRWLALATETLDPPQRLAQMVVVCQPAPGASVVVGSAKSNHTNLAVVASQTPVPAAQAAAQRLPNPGKAPVTGYDD